MGTASIPELIKTPDLREFFFSHIPAAAAEFWEEFREFGSRWNFSSDLQHEVPSLPGAAAPLLSLEKHQEKPRGEGGKMGFSLFLSCFEPCFSQVSMGFSGNCRRVLGRKAVVGNVGKGDF